MANRRTTVGPVGVQGKTVRDGLARAGDFANGRTRGALARVHGTTGVEVVGRTAHQVLHEEILPTDSKKKVENWGIDGAFTSIQTHSCMAMASMTYDERRLRSKRWPLVFL